MNLKHAPVTPTEIRHPANAALPIFTRVRCLGTGDDPKVGVSFMFDGEWSSETDWWRACQDPDFRPQPGADALPESARAELEDRGWELLSQLGYIPKSWHEGVAAHES